MGRGGAEGEREECQADSRLIMEPDTGLSLMTLSSWPDLKLALRCAAGGATGYPCPGLFCSKSQTSYFIHKSFRIYL